MIVAGPQTIQLRQVSGTGTSMATCSAVPAQNGLWNISKPELRRHLRTNCECY